MIRKCARCQATMNALVEKLYDLIGEIEDDDETEFDQLTRTDQVAMNRSNLTHNKETVFEYVELVCEKLTKLAPQYTFVFGEESTRIPEIKKGRYELGNNIESQ